MKYEMPMISNPPNNGTLNTVGALGFNTSDLVGFDISGASGVAFASLTTPAGNFSQLFTINLATGAATLVGNIGGGIPLVALASWHLLRFVLRLEPSKSPGFTELVTLVTDVTP